MPPNRTAASAQRRGPPDLDRSATALGGLVLLFEMLAAKRILADLTHAGGSPSQGWSDAQMILAIPPPTVHATD